MADHLAISQPLLVASYTEVDRLAEAAHAELAALAVELRQALHEAANAEQAAGERAQQPDTNGVAALIRTAADDLVAARRAALEAAVERASRTIAAANVEAERIVAAARARTHPVLRRDAGAFAAREREIVTSEQPASPPPATAAPADEAAADGSRVVGMTRSLCVDVALPLAISLAVIAIVLSVMG